MDAESLSFSCKWGVRSQINSASLISQGRVWKSFIPAAKGLYKAQLISVKPREVMDKVCELVKMKTERGLDEK